MKEHFFLLQLGSFFGDFFLQTRQWCYIVFAIDGSSFLKIIDALNIFRFPKYGGQNFACWYLRLWSLWTAFTCCCPLSWLPIWPRSEVVGPCFIHCHIFTQKLLIVTLKLLQRTLWIVDALLLLTMSKRGTLFKQSFLIDKCSCKIVNTLLSDTFNSSAISRNCNLRSAKTSLWSFFGVFQDNCRNWATWESRNICVCTTAFKFTIIPLVSDGAESE